MIFLVCFGCAAPTSEISDKRDENVVIIGTGGTKGVYYPTGKAICTIVNKHRKEHGIHCSIESTRGSVTNINEIMSGDLAFGMAQSDRQYQAWHGLAEWKSMGPQENLRSVFSIYAETVTLVAAVDAGIETIHDLKNKKVNIGNPGSALRMVNIDTLETVGINWEKDIEAVGVKASESSKLLQDGRIDAFFYIVAHPYGPIKQATSGKRKARFIPITGIENLLKKLPYYAKASIPIQFYPGVSNSTNVETFGLKSTFVTSTGIPEEIVYNITKAIFEDFDTFKKSHPAYTLSTKQSMLEALSAPIHPGALRYYEEVGLK
ncbi:MAG: TAXI family TRAP transporter solute-binding subunit [Deltaproteobacteria bacterium]|nr:TAXI family TRAP transporter solute-binding subunit [Deltaproteobacteria bacterium]